MLPAASLLVVLLIVQSYRCTFKELRYPGKLLESVPWSSFAYLQSANEERPVIIPFVPAVLTQLFHPLITPANYGVLPLLS